MVRYTPNTYPRARLTFYEFTMFSLVLTIISIALVAALALSTLYYGGNAFESSSARTEATKIALQGQQLLGAAELFYNDKREWPTALAQLESGGYLKQIPVAVLSGLDDAVAAGQSWSLPIPKNPMFLLGSMSSEKVCAEINFYASLGKRKVLPLAYQGLVVQCYGAETRGFRAVFRRSTDTLLGEGGLGLPLTEIRPGVPPTGPTDVPDEPPPGAGLPGTPFFGTQTLDVPGNPVYAKLLGLNFGWVPLGATVAMGPAENHKVFSLTGGYSLYELRIESDNPRFVVTHNCPLRLDFNSSCTVSVAFSPAFQGPHSGLLRFYYYDGYGEVMDIENVVLLTGNGGTPPID